MLVTYIFQIFQHFHNVNFFLYINKAMRILNATKSSLDNQSKNNFLMQLI